MGVPSQAQLHSLTDALAARVKKDLDGFESELASLSALSLWDQVDAIGDPFSEASLMAAAFAVDRMSLPGNHATNLGSILARTPYRDFASALNNLVKDPSGGSYSSFVAYLLDKAAVLHPLAAELFRAILGETALTSSSLVNSVFPPNYSSLFPTRVFAGADGALVDLTTAAGNATTADLTLFSSNSHALYIGSRRPFDHVVVALSTKANVTIAPLIEYYNGTGWMAVAGLVDNSTGFTKNDTIKFTRPSDWTPSYLDKAGNVFAASAKERLYYLRIARTAATVGTPPVGTCITVIPTPVLNSAGKHLGIDQPPVALVRFPSSGNVTVEPIAGVETTRWKAGVFSLRALTPLATFNLTLAYVNQAGATVTQAQGSWTTPAALDVQAGVLNGTDTGLASVPATGSTTTGTNAEGVAAVRIAELRTPAL